MASGRRAALGLVAALSFVAGCEESDPLPELGEMPAFELVDQDGERFTRTDVEGKVVIATFLFTRCVTICPILSQRTAEMASRLESHSDAVHFLSFSVDPEHDTPALLRAHGERYGAHFDRWTFLTGDIEEVNEVVVRGFKLAMGEPQPGPGDTIEIMHSPRFILVDQQGKIRGYYESNEEGMAELEKAVEALL